MWGVHDSDVFTLGYAEQGCPGSTLEPEYYACFIFANLIQTINSTKIMIGGAENVKRFF